MGERVLVTGGTGVVGGAAARALRAAGWEVVSLQRGPLSPDLAALGVIEARGDVTNAASVAQALQGIEAVVHAAARVDITGPWEDFERINVGGTRTVLAAAEGAGVRRFVFVSSPSVAHAGRPLVGAGADPADPDSARSSYARSKAMAELLALAADRPGFAVTAIRPHLVWGPGDTQLTGRIIERARAGRLVLIGSGAALIDTTYIDNAGEALAAAVSRAADEAVHGRAFVVSNGEPRTVAEMLTRIARAGGAPGPSRSVPYPIARAGGRVLEGYWGRAGREGDPPVTAFLAEQLATAHWFDQRQTRQALGWSPRVSLDEGFRLLALGAPAGA
ncbi:MAG: NAD-dependent epimerase/dehydratase family protein [Candidatus Nanopelagicales bacterium]